MVTYTIMEAPMNASRPQVSIAGGGYSAEIALRGGQLLSLRSQDLDIVVPVASAEGAFAGSVLTPWPNRIANAAYEHDGVSYELPAVEEGTGAALHGLLHEVDLDVLSQKEHEVHLSGHLPAQEGYPFDLDVVVVYRVSAGTGLSWSLLARYSPQSEDAPATAPFGAGFHPYLTAGGAPLKECRLRLPARTYLTAKAGGRAKSHKSVTGDYDLSNGPLLAGRRIDHAFTDLPEDGWTAELLHGPSGFVVRMIADAPWVQVYTGEQIERSGVAVEPMTCPPDAFNSGEDVIQLAPGEWFRFGCSIEAIRTD